ncbi:hypothetical protein IFM89_033278 [Coptis chinensis]|uniref:RNase H type-1 domain-containing protein n=1 Tax=Coptis chinensis TaxID=261450 RepID=A0A835IIL4_9MAGN|nr:hypothetical protein IFM89_033278 [Coptis chinensis]
MQRLGIQTQFVTKVPVTCTWASPEADEVTLNPDGSISNNGSSYGGLVRNSEGGVHFMYKGCNPSSSVLVQELRAILQGLKGCKIMDFRKVKVASDSLRAVRILLGSESAPWDHEGRILGACSKKMKATTSAEIELLATELAVEFVLLQQLRDIIFEGDAMEVVEAYKHGADSAP